MSYGSPRDFHNDQAEVSADAPAVFHPPTTQQHDLVALESAAFEKGRMQGEIEAVRRLENEPRKIFNEEVTSTTTVNAPDVVEVNQLTKTQWSAAVLGELCGLGYIVIMAIWVDQYRTGGTGWSNNDQNGNRGMFNVHLITSFLGLWCVSQAYITYRVLPMSMNVTLNKLYYVMCHAAALACFAISIAAATMSAPSTRAWSMHAWTTYLAVAVYAAHAFYSCMKVMLNRHGISTSNWNETRNGEPTGHASNPTPEQARDGEVIGQPQTLYTAGPSAGIFRKHNKEANLDIDSRNANMGATHGPVWSEQATYTRDRFFLVPRAKWGVTSMFMLMASVLIGLGELQTLRAVGRDNWTTDPNNDNNRMGEFSTDSILFGVLGLLTMASIALLGYASMPPRTTLAKGHTDRVQQMQRRRTSVSTVPSTVHNTRLGHENQYAQSIEVV